LAVPSLFSLLPAHRRVEAREAPARVFLVGCPRSGTTLLQSMLFGHRAVMSFPETFFFDFVTPGGRIARNLGFSSARAAQGYRQLEELGLPGVSLDRPPRRLRRCAEDLVATLDAATAEERKRAWVEKTPLHLRYIRYIKRHVPGVSFVHMIRGGTGVIPSLYDVTNRFPDEWDGARSLEQCIRRWKRDLRLSATHVGHPGHAFVSYESLVDRPEAVLGSLCEFLDLEADEAALETMLGQRSERLARVVRDEPWKQGVATAIVDRGVDKLDELSAAQQNQVRDAVTGSQALLNRIPLL
jgi:Sulfotransferase family